MDPNRLLTDKLFYELLIRGLRHDGLVSDKRSNNGNIYAWKRRMLTLSS